MSDELVLDLDELCYEGFYHTKYDIGGCGHSIRIKKEDKEVFLDEFTRIYRERTEKLLREVEDDEDE